MITKRWTNCCREDLGRRKEFGVAQPNQRVGARDGEKQLELDFYKMEVEILNEEEGEDLLKKYARKLWQESAQDNIASTRYVNTLG